MKLIISLTILVFVFILIGRPEVSFSPFRVALPEWHKSVGFFLIAIGFVVYDVIEGQRNYKKGFKEGIEYVIKEVENESRKDIQKQS